MAELANAEYTLYSSPFSLYSMMARHTIQLGPTTQGARPPKKITLSFVNHKKNENLREEYLKVNPKGQVPTMTSNVLEQPLTDSISISLYLAEKHYPAMLPAEHAAVIKDLLQRFHAIPGLSFSNKNPTAEMTQHNRSPVEDILKRTDLSPEYRKALEVKLEFHNKGNGVVFQPAIKAKHLADLQAIFAEIAEHRRQSGASGTEGEWTFGAQVGPTVLDSHLLPLVLRCVEAGNAELVPPELQRWAEVKAKSPVWQKVMHGRPTTWAPSMGPVEDMQDMMSL
ncbi:hypothetical protein M406DRAFT_354053 [Cryphonectria parasitica EP155]|uniref:GST N-terminal domain-containing protein n=1 Tax=Cryphonectria parasitica (strain ATCC 38755 / EP155) TaxID=660469 RepID=A0A9P5CTE2_CRYP1|nr:uncharacterized protein M406DRAFT_354053 [Cryphonectria parasitica EP155]KAF3769577.1 hypothetical protein M406DRAFT_354053 [Cryphonectria parasitica EP155]